MTAELVDWADEEGARFGRSLFGSSARRRARSTPTRCATSRTRGRALADALPQNGVDLDDGGRAARRTARAPTSSCTSSRARCSSEMGKPAGAVIGSFGVERHAVRFTGKASHAGATPMDLRRDAFLAAARFAPGSREVAHRAATGVATIGTRRPRARAS